MIQKEYAENIATICSYTTAIQNLNVTISVTPVPKWYTDELKQRFVSSKTHAAAWTNDILHLLRELPESIIDYDILYKSNADDIKDLCSLLKKGPTKYAEEKQKKAIQKLATGVTTKKDLIQDVINILDKYISTIGEDNTFFDNAYKSACKEIDVDQEQLKAFQKTKKEIVIGIIAFAAALTLLITSIVESKICAQKEAELTACISKMNEMTRTVESLTLFSDELKKIVDAAAAARGAAKAILDCWTALEIQMSNLITDIGKYDEKAADKLYDDIINGIDAESKAWDEIVTSAKNYAAIDIEVKKEVQEIYKSA